MMLARIVEIAYGRAKKMGLPAVVGGLTNEKFEQLIEFTDQLWRAGGYNSRPQDERGEQESLREEITPFEFLCFMLTQNESVSLDEIKQIMANFSELDLNKTGLLDQSTVDEWLRRGSSNPQGFAPSRPDSGELLCACLPTSCCPVVRKRLACRRLLQGGACCAVASAVASGVLARVLAPPPAEPAPPPSSCGVARNSTTTCVPWTLAGTHLFDRRTGELQMDKANTLEETQFTGL
eukprot:g10330.t1